MEMINGYRCKTCTDVDYAKKHIDPAHPKDGPFGVNRQDQSGVAKTPHNFGPAVKVDGQFLSASKVDPTKTVTAANPPAAPQPDKTTGRVLDVVA